MVFRHILSLAAVAATACATSSNSVSQVPLLDPRSAQIVVNAVSNGCTPERIEQAHQKNQACALLVYRYAFKRGEIITAGEPTSVFLRPALGVIPSPEGDPLQARIHVISKRAKRPETVALNDLKTHLIRSYSPVGEIEYRLVAAIYPALCQSDPDYCMASYDASIFDLARYSE